MTIPCFRAFVLAGLTIAIGCSKHNPVGPTPLPIQPGAFVLVTSPSNLSGSACSGSGGFNEVVASSITLSREGSTWVARSATTEYGNVELRFNETRAASGPVLVAGVASGTTVDQRGGAIDAQVGMTFLGDGSSGTTLAGSFEPTPRPRFVGTATGMVRISRFAGIGFCGAATWEIRKPE
jgi:hypothetical protein